MARRQSLSRWAKDNRDLFVGLTFTHPQALGKSWRTSDRYKRWRSDVFTRDGHRCTECGKRPLPTNLQVHHIVPASVCPQLKYEPRNGRVLCLTCHSKPQMHQMDPEFWRRIAREL